MPTRVRASLSCAPAPGACLLDGGQPAAERGRLRPVQRLAGQHLQAQAGEDAASFSPAAAARWRTGPRRAPDDCELPFTGGLLGYLGYDFGRRLERLPQHAAADLALPDADFGVYAWALVSDHQRRTSRLVFHPA